MRLEWAGQQDMEVASCYHGKKKWNSERPMLQMMSNSLPIIHSAIMICEYLRVVQLTLPKNTQKHTKTST